MKEVVCKHLPGKSAIVTGAAQGLGEAIAKRLAAEGANVVISDINLEKLKVVAEAIKNEYGVRAIPVLADVTNEQQVADMVQTAVREFGKLDILVANAGILIAGPVVEFSTEQWRKVIDVNLVGYFICAKEAAKVMMAQKSGVIIQINSKSGKKGSFRNSAYAASKFGGIGLTQSLALEMAPYNVRVNAVCPGNILEGTLWQESLFEQYSKTQGLTPEQVKEKYLSQVPLGRSCRYEDVANVVVFLASDQSSYMTGQAINVTGGQEMR
ncbi:MAG: sorbitol-6-phosphate dehydrogenase [Armatimonadota bacterium]|nr:sorbitol-6-phosphate dehydrogenase [Armatimonadota bacterium]